MTEENLSIPDVANIYFVQWLTVTQAHFQMYFLMQQRWFFETWAVWTSIVIPDPRAMERLVRKISLAGNHSQSFWLSEGRVAALQTCRKWEEFPWQLESPTSATNSHAFCWAVSWTYGLLKISLVCFCNHELLKTTRGSSKCIGQLISSNLQTKSSWTDGFAREMSAWIWSRSGVIKNW